MMVTRHKLVPQWPPFFQERAYIPEGQRYSIQNAQAAFCFSETIPAPTGKEEAQQRTVSSPRPCLHKSSFPSMQP
jgi:hypothetical protein